MPDTANPDTVDCTRSLTIDCTPQTSAADIARQLESVSGYREKSIDDQRAVVTVGNKLKARFFGASSTNYTTPVRVTIEKEGAQAHVYMESSMNLMISLPKYERMLVREYDRLEGLLR